MSACIACQVYEALIRLYKYYSEWQSQIRKKSATFIGSKQANTCNAPTRKKREMYAPLDLREIGYSL